MLNIIDRLKGLNMEKGANKVVNLKEKYSHFDGLWTPRIVGELDDSYVKVFKAKGEFVAHSHPDEDELFFVVKGKLTLKLPDQEVVLNEGEFFIVPKGVEHCPYAEDEAHVLLVEKKSLRNAQPDGSQKSSSELEWI